MTVLVLVLLLLYGVPLALAFEPRLRGAALAGTAFLLGAGAAWLHLFLLSVIGVPWSRTSVILAMAPLFCLGVLRRSRSFGNVYQSGGSATALLNDSGS